MPPKPAFPQWALDLSEKYRSGSCVMFVLTENVHDLVPVFRNGAPDFVTLKDFLDCDLFSGRDLVLSYDRGGGLGFAKAEMQADFRRALEGYDAYHGSQFAQVMPRNPDGVLNLLDNYFRLRLMDHKRMSLTIAFAETMIPAGDALSLPENDRNSLVILKRWAHNPLFLRNDVTLCLIAENLIELNQGIIQHPGVATIRIPLPEVAERRAFIEWQLARTPLPEGSSIGVEALAQLTSGLKRVQLQALLGHAHFNGLPLTVEGMSRRKKEMIMAESGGMLEFVQTRFNLSNIAGSVAAKGKLQDAASAIKDGRTDVLPMGYVLCGPVGTGKTFLATCFAGDVGIPAVVLKNFRSMWQGVTEGNLERVLNLLKVMSPIVVIVDEADAQLGDRSSSGDSGVSSRVFAQIAQFMGNTDYRGKVIWFLLTSRPDLLPVDLKRQGRAEEHLALFYPETADERLAMVRAMVRKAGIAQLSAEIEQMFLDKVGSLSGADIEAILTRARMKSALEKDVVLDAGDVSHVLSDFIPPSYPSEIELQNLVAVIECTSRSLLPAKYRDMNRDELLQRVSLLKQMV